MSAIDVLEISGFEVQVCALCNKGTFKNSGDIVNCTCKQTIYHVKCANRIKTNLHCKQCGDIMLSNKQKSCVII